MESEYHLITILVLHGLVEHSRNFLVTLENDIFTNTTGRRENIYINPKLQELYICTRERYLKDLSYTYFHVTLALDDILRTINRCSGNLTTKNDINNFKNSIALYKETVQLLKEELKQMVGIIDGNKVQFSTAIRWAISFSAWLLLSVILANVYFCVDKDNSTKRNLLIATSVLCGLAIVAVVLSLMFLERWNIKRAKFAIAKEA